MGRFEKISINISFSDCVQGVLRLVFMLQLAHERVCVNTLLSYMTCMNKMMLMAFSLNSPAFA